MSLVSIAIKINVSHKDQAAINQMLESAGYKPQRRKFHCTIGFIEKMVPSEEAISFGQAIIHELQPIIKQTNLIYEVDSAAHCFGHVLVFTPTFRSKALLEKLNLWLSQKVQEISKCQWELNKESHSNNFNPHLTLWHTRHPDHRFKKLEEYAESRPIYHLTEASYVIFYPKPLMEDK